MPILQMFTPKLFETLRSYKANQLSKDMLAGLVVGIVALPLAIAFAIACGVSPEKGLYTAIIAGFIISALGGSRVQIGGPTGAFIVIISGIVQQHGVSGLIVATCMAGVMLIILGLTRLGSVIKFIPYPLIIGFTSGIALLIFSSQVKDFLGLQLTAVPSDFFSKWKTYFLHFSALNIFSLVTAVVTVVIIYLAPKINRLIPGSLIAILVTTILVNVLHLPVETIGSRFGDIPSSLPLPEVPELDGLSLRELMQPAFTIALLAGIESLLSALVADGMIGDTHKSNMELVAQGTANIFSAVFGGIPATGAIARTVTNIKSGGRTPVAGIVHALVLLLIMLFAGRWVALIPLSALAGILMVVAYNMSEWHSFIAVLKGSVSDSVVLLVTFLLTVFIDLTVAIEIGMVLAAFLFMRKMIQFSGVQLIEREINDEDTGVVDKRVASIPAGVQVFEIRGPLFFGAAYKFKEALSVIHAPVKILIIRMRHVPIIDATGIKVLKEVVDFAKHRGATLMLSEINSEQVMEALQKARLLFAIGKGNITSTLNAALEKSNQYLHKKS